MKFITSNSYKWPRYAEHAFGHQFVIDEIGLLNITHMRSILEAHLHNSRGAHADTSSTVKEKAPFRRGSDELDCTVPAGHGGREPRGGMRRPRKW